MYKVIKFFTDLNDNEHAYKVGDTFPREGVEVNPERLKALSTSENKRGIPVIEEVKEATLEEVDVEEKATEEAPTEVEKPKRKPRKKG